MSMAVNEVARCVNFYKPSEAFKALVAEIGLIVNAEGGSMGHDNIKIAFFQKLVLP